MDFFVCLRCYLYFKPIVKRLFGSVSLLSECLSGIVVKIRIVLCVIFVSFFPSSFLLSFFLFSSVLPEEVLIFSFFDFHPVRFTAMEHGQYNTLLLWP